MISFVVIAYNEAANIAAALQAIMRLDELSEYEVVVVDDGSLDGTADIVRDIAQRCPYVRLIALEQNRGRGHARWRGINAARGNLVATIDADIILPSDWLIRARDALKYHDAVGGTAVPDGDVGYIYRRFRLAPRVVSATNIVTGNNALYRREVFDVVEFDPKLREGEDSALNHAMIRAGFSCVTVSDLIVRHEENKSLSTSVKWLFEVGCGATRQLFTLHRVRQPDIVTIAFLGALALGAFNVAQERVLLGVAIPILFILAASVQHVRSRFYLSKSRWAAALAAVVTNSLLLTAYFAGRVVGLTLLLRRGHSRRTHAADAGDAQYVGDSMRDGIVSK
jgi:glycosyltransferase involved in cell wall biosynthesis